MLYQLSYLGEPRRPNRLNRSSVLIGGAHKACKRRSLCTPIQAPPHPHLCLVAVAARRTHSVLRCLVLDIASDRIRTSEPTAKINISAAARTKRLVCLIARRGTHRTFERPDRRRVHDTTLLCPSITVNFGKLQPVELYRETFRHQHLHRFGQRQPYNVCVRALQFLNEAPREALDGVATSLAAPFT